MKIGIDIDEVIVELVKGYLKYYEEKKGVKRRIEEVIDYHLETLLEISLEEHIKLFNEYYKSRLFAEISFIEGSVDSIMSLAKKHELYFITARPIHLKNKTSNFLKKTFPKLSFEIFYSGDFHGDHRTKAEICQELGIEIMVEDHGDFALSCAKVGVKTFLLEKPWNKNGTDHKNLIKVKNWVEIIEKIK